MWRSTVPDPGEKQLAFGEFMVAPCDRLDPAKPAGHSGEFMVAPGDTLYWWNWQASTGSEGTGRPLWLRGAIAHSDHWAARL